MGFNSTDEISSSEAQKIIRKITSDGTVIFTHHAKERMMERGYSTHDVEFILKHGIIVKKSSEIKLKHGHIRLLDKILKEMTVL